MRIPAHTIIEVIDMASYVSPKIRDKFETLSVDLKNCILERNVHLETLQDLIKVLDEIVKREADSIQRRQNHESYHE